MTSSNFRQYPAIRPRPIEESQAEFDSLRELDQVSAESEEEKKKKEAEFKKNEPKLKAQQDAQKQKLQEPTGIGGALKTGIRELGTAVVGAGIDAVEGLGANVQQALTGNLSNPNFKPTWLQLDDKVEPLNKTWWGGLIRSVGEFGILSAGLRGAGGAAAGRAGVVGRAGTILSKPGLKGELIRGAVASNLSSQSLGPNTSQILTEIWPWFPDVLATKDSDHPLLKRAKTTLEGMGMDGTFDRIAAGIKWGWTRARTQEANLVAEQAKVTAKQAEAKAALEQKRQREAQTAEIKKTYDEARNRVALAEPETLGKPKDDPSWAALKKAKDEAREAGVRYRAAKAAEKVTTAAAPSAPTAPKPPDPAAPSGQGLAPVRSPEAEADAAAAQLIKENQASRQANFDELAESRLADDPEGLNGPDPYVNSPLYDANEKPIFSTKKDGLEKALLDAYRIDADPRYRDGRPETLFTEAALEKRLAGENASRRAVIESVARKIGKDKEFIGEVNGVRVTRKEYKNLAVARMLDTLDEFSDPEDLEAFKAKLMSQPASQSIGGKSISYMNIENLAAAELFLNVTAGEMADLASAARSVRGAIDTTTQENMILRRMEFLLKETKLAKFIWGQTGNQMKAGGTNLLSKANLDEVSQAIDSEVATTISTLKDLRDQGDDALIQHFIDAASISGGKIQTLVDLDRYMKDRIHKWNGNPSEQGGIIKGFVSTFINSVLSGPKTVLRAWVGTSLAVALRPITLYTGALMRGDARLQAKAFHQMAVWHEGAGEALNLFGKAIKNHLAGEAQPYSSFAGNTDALHRTEAWQALGEWVESRGDLGNKAGYGLATMMSRFNSFPPINYSMGLMGAGDAANRTILGRMELKSMAFDRAWDASKGKVDANLVRKYEEEMRSLVFDKDGLVTDRAATLAGDEAALTTDLGKNFQQLDNLINQFPPLKAFFMFPKTSVNALKYAFTFNPLGTKVPILNKFLQEVDEVVNVTPDTLEAVMTKYGIKDIEATKAMYEGRVAFGQLVTFSAAGLYLNGRLTGNGPYDKETRNAWIQAGWRPRSIQVFGIWFGYDSIDPFASLLAMVADIGDNSDQLGQMFTETWYERVSYVIAMNLTNKSFMQGIQPLAEILSAGGVGAQAARVPSMFLNNAIPFSSLRKEIAEGMNPGMRELEDNFIDFIKNRNPGFKGTLPYKRDVLDGKPLRLYEPMVRFANIVSPFQINPDWSETRELLRLSGFDIALTLKTDSKGNRLNAEQRSRMQNEMGSEGIESQLDQLFKTEAYLKSYKFARELRNRGIPSDQWPIEANYHTQAIKQIFNTAKANAEARIRLTDGETDAVRKARTLSVAKEAAKAGDFDKARGLLDMYK